VLFDVFVDPALRARQDKLNSVWQSMNNLKQGCDGLPDSAWLEFVTDYKAWGEFYDSGSDWSSSSKTATDEWQVKAQSWTKRLADYGCRGSLGVDITLDNFGNPTGRSEVYTPAADQGIPGVKDPPPDPQGPIDKIEGWIATVGWVVAGLVVLLIAGLVYVLSRPTLHRAVAGGR